MRSSSRWPAPADVEGRSFNISNGEPVRVRDLLDRLFAALSMRVRYVPLPRALALALARGNRSARAAAARKSGAAAHDVWHRRARLFADLVDRGRATGARLRAARLDRRRAGPLCAGGRRRDDRARVVPSRSGTCTHPEASSREGASWRSCEFPAWVTVLRHPVSGWILFDTGYGEAFLHEMRRFPERLYGVVTPVHFDPRRAVAAQLQARGMDAADIGTIVVSHLHGDHVGALADFPRARIFCSEAAWADLHSRSRISALAKGLLPALTPPSLLPRVRWLESSPRTRSPRRCARSSTASISSPTAACSRCRCRVTPPDTTGLLQRRPLGVPRRGRGVVASGHP